LGLCAGLLKPRQAVQEEAGQAAWIVEGEDVKTGKEGITCQPLVNFANQ
jgi:hypothetical protein